ncbi:MAG: glycosyltransferase family 4 protein [Selenomonas sp.]|uniref:glycosyltransferase family 4 protein n=1 Tax=Selenomonas sp. TaxID=2053611 RepID=UPI0025E3F61A|nr:glycosyltransferase family 4 protein [Selenomonas sp.]MCR5438568.1 glycosyltransferase family 4 protein [Selenomonas sp.]
MSNKDLNRFLLIEGDFVYPPNHGGRVDAWNRIITIHEMGGYIHLICTVKTYPRDDYMAVVKQYVDEITILPRKNRLLDMLYNRPLQMVSRRCLKHIKFEKAYDYIILNGSYVYDVLENDTLRVKHKILRMNNDESTYFKGLGQATSSWVKKIYYYWESRKFKSFDEKLIRNIPNVMFVSHDEVEDYKKKYPWMNGCFLPTAVALDFKRRDLKNNCVLMVGSFFMVNNQEGIRFYIENVHPLLNDIPQYKLVIAGNSRGQSIKWLKKLALKYNNIEVYDSPDELEPLYNEATVFVNPMLHGAGVKLKTINAVIEGLPVVATSVGNEGTGLLHGRDIIVTDDAKEMAENIKKLFGEEQYAREIVDNAQMYVRENYDQRKSLLKFLNNLSESEC